MSTPSATVRIGVIGLGNMGSSHIRDFIPKVPRLQLTAVCDADASRLANYPDVAPFSDPAALIGSGAVDAVLIATPHYAHTEVGIDALSAGLHVLVEKPISVHKADCERLIAAHQPGTVFAAMFNQRTDPHYLALRRMIQGGELGAIKRINWTITNWFRSAAYYSSGGWRATWAGEGGGVLMNQAPHNLDLYQWLFGMPSRVRAFCRFGQYHDIEVEDDVTAYLEYENGTTATFITSTGEFPGTNRLEIACDRGRVVVEQGNITFERTTESVQAFSDATPSSFPSMETWKCEVPVRGYGDQHLGIIRNFTEAILDGVPLIAPAAEGLHSVELANAMILSSVQQRTVELPFDGAEYADCLRGLVASSTRRS
ncbi:MAG: Gfo/Idh/MocA family oxidoreductase [Fimbriimonadaceae bacterium]|nr:Gfo/Idh/MocA family oxidoreductase [Fimbriimonadaceae bacterium]